MLYYLYFVQFIVGSVRVRAEILLEHNTISYYTVFTVAQKNAHVVANSVVTKMSHTKSGCAHIQECNFPPIVDR